jgi:hypothetical protein
MALALVQSWHSPAELLATTVLLLMQATSGEVTGALLDRAPTGTSAESVGTAELWSRRRRFAVVAQSISLP